MKRTALAIWFVAAAVLVAANSYVCFVNVRTLIGHSDLVAQSREIIIATETLLSMLKEAETSQRGFLLTGDATYLPPYRDAAGRAERQVGVLARLVEGQPEEVERVASLNTLVHDRLAELAEVVTAHERGGPVAAVAELKENRGRGLMDRAVALARDVRGTEKQILDRRTAERNASARAATGTLVGSGAFNLLLLGGVAYAVRRDAVVRARAAEDAVRQMALERDNARLAAEVDERRRTNETLTALTTRLEQSNRELQDFASVASHDLQEPLRKIQAFGDRLRTKFAAPLGDAGRDYVDRMHAAAGRMQTLINDLLSFSRVTTKAQPFIPVDLGAVAREVLSDLEARVEQTGGRVELGDLPTIDADPLQMRQLLQNLIANGLKFRKPDVPPVVTVTAEVAAAGGGCELRVADNGIGFDEKYLDRIFNVFQRLHGRDEYEGTGIGLAVCRKIAERHGGSITARSRPGEGATFVVTLPASHAAEPRVVELPTTSQGNATDAAHAQADHDPARR
jgi:signal transduction histidine kinase